jgi:hypothetical protein
MRFLRRPAIASTTGGPIERRRRNFVALNRGRPGSRYGDLSAGGAASLDGGRGSVALGAPDAAFARTFVKRAGIALDAFRRAPLLTGERIPRRGNAAPFALTVSRVCKMVVHSDAAVMSYRTLWPEVPRAPPMFVIAKALRTGVEDARQAWNNWSAGVPYNPACCARGRERDLSGFLAIRPMPLPCSKTPAEPARPRPWRSCRHRPRPTQAEGLSGYIISRLTQSFSIRCLRFTSGVAATHARLASGWRAAPLPGGGRTLWIASKGFRLHLHSPFQDFS